LVVSFPEAPTSRRKLLQASAPALLLAGCGGGSSPIHRALSKQPRVLRRSDVAILNAALDLEHKVIAAYTAGIPLLDGAGKSAAQRFLGQDLSHAGELSGLVHDAGGKPRKPAPSYDLGSPRNGADVLRLLHSLERATITAYLDAIPKLSAGELRAAVASMFANDAQHLSVLRSTLGSSPVPAALVTGLE
jgi:hypothetical protein